MRATKPQTGTPKLAALIRTPREQLQILLHAQLGVHIPIRASNARLSSKQQLCVFSNVMQTNVLCFFFLSPEKWAMAVRIDFITYREASRFQDPKNHKAIMLKSQGFK
jgi:hypothetical protein